MAASRSPASSKARRRSHASSYRLRALLPVECRAVAAGVAMVVRINHSLSVIRDSALTSLLVPAKAMTVSLLLE
jgi:hypothetical protein